MTPKMVWTWYDPADARACRCLISLSSDFTPDLDLQPESQFNDWPSSSWLDCPKYRGDRCRHAEIVVVIGTSPLQ